MIKINAIKKIYGDRTVLDISSLEIKKGERVVIIGPNGSGKSTLLKILAGTLKATCGDFEREGTLYYLPQHSLPFSMSVRKNVLYCIEGSKAEKERICDELLKKLGLSHLADKNAKKLSGGESQRLALCRVLAKKGDIILLDEPTSAADIESEEIIEQALLDYVNESGCTLIITTHSPAQAKKFGDRIIMLHGGTVAEDGTPDELFKSPKTKWGAKFIDNWRIG